MHIFLFIYVHLRKEKMRIYERELSVYVHLGKRDFVYAHIAFSKCAFREAKMCIYNNSLLYMSFCLLYMQIYGRHKCAFMEENFHICAFWFP
jgi:hypothetical protein